MSICVNSQTISISLSVSFQPRQWVAQRRRIGVCRIVSG